MTPADLDAQLHQMRRALRPVSLWGGVLAASVEVAILVTTFRAYPPGGHDRNALAWYITSFIACWVPILAWYLVLRRLLSKFAPKCELCGHVVTFPERDRIVSTGQCPKCGCTVIAAGSDGA